jgi:hypothetical protein
MTSNENNKVEIKNRYNDKIKCEICEVVYTKCNKAHHEKTKRHQNAELKKKMEKIKKLESESSIKAINEIKKNIEMIMTECKLK